MKALALLLLFAFPAWAQDPFAVPVRRGRCVEDVVTQGELRSAATVNIHAPEVEEPYLTVKRVLDNGTPVKKGDVVLEFDDNLYQLSLKAALQEVDLRRAMVDLVKFQLEDERIKTDLDIKRKEISVAKAQTEVVRDSTIISAVELKKAELSVELAMLELNQAKANRAEFDKKHAVSLKVKELELAESQRKVEHLNECLRKIVVKAPKDGVIYKPFVRLNNEKGRVERNKVVRPGDKLLEIPSFEKFEGVCYLPSGDSRLVKVGDVALVRLTVQTDVSHRAKVLRKDAYPMTRNERLGRDDNEGHLKEFEVVLELERAEPAFRPGATFTATIEAVLGEDAVYVPHAAVRTAAGASTVQVAGRADPAPVKLGAVGFSFAVIADGLSAGQSVMLGSPAK